MVRSITILHSQYQFLLCVCMFMCVYMYVCIHVYVLAHVCIVQNHLCICTCTFEYVCIHVHVCAFLYVRGHVCMLFFNQPQGWPAPCTLHTGLGWLGRLWLAKAVTQA